MTNLDQQISEALDAEDRAILEQYGDLSLWGQFQTLLQGKGAWMTYIIMVIGTVVTFIGLYAAWKFIVADSVGAMIQWGALAWSLFTTQIMLKLWSWMRMESNRVIREVKRVELQIARLQLKEQK